MMGGAGVWLWRGVSFEPFSGTFSRTWWRPAEDDVWADIAIEPDTADGGCGEAGGDGNNCKANYQAGAEGETGECEPPDRKCQNE